MRTLTKNGFTLIEAVFAIVVIGILAAVAIPKFIATRSDASEATVKREIQAIRAGIEAEKMQNIQASGTMQSNGDDGNLTLYYNYRPWEGDTYLDGSSSVIMQDVDTFQFKAVGDLLKVQLCVKDGNISSDGGYSICKEKTLF